jgi:hypothetical protein
METMHHSALYDYKGSKCHEIRVDKTHNERYTITTNYGEVVGEYLTFHKMLETLNALINNEFS